MCLCALFVAAESDSFLSSLSTLGFTLSTQFHPYQFTYLALVPITTSHVFVNATARGQYARITTYVLDGVAKPASVHTSLPIANGRSVVIGIHVEAEDLSASVYSITVQQRGKRTVYIYVCVCLCVCVCVCVNMCV